MKPPTESPFEKTSGVVIRRGEPADAPAVAELMGALGYPNPVTHLERRLAECGQATDTAIFLAELAGQVVGSVSVHCIPLFHAEGFLGRITSLIVSSEHRQRGVGRRLVAAAEEFAWSHGCRRMEVTSGDHRPEAHAFYEHLGYHSDCRRFIKRD